jgi:hypothetical protein
MGGICDKDATNFCQAEHRAEPWGIGPTYLETGPLDREKRIRERANNGMSGHGPHSTFKGGFNLPMIGGLLQ